MRLHALVAAAADRLEASGVCFGHGTTNAWDEAAWLVLWRLGLPLSTVLDTADDAVAQPLTVQQQQQVHALIAQRIATRQPAAYLTGEAWLQGLCFHADARAIVPRSLIAEPLVQGVLDNWLTSDSASVLDLCTGGASLAILAAIAWPHLRVDASDICAEALAVAAINLERHPLAHRVRLLQGDALADLGERYDLILCNPPYVNSRSMQSLPPEYRAEPGLALAGGVDGMDFVRRLLREAPSRMREHAALVLEIGNERAHFEAAFPALEVLWLDTSAGDEQVCVLTRAALLHGGAGHPDITP